MTHGTKEALRKILGVVLIIPLALIILARVAAAGPSAWVGSAVIVMALVGVGLLDI